jgi:quercetin dioxygenase-like cupin family protein
MRKTIWLVAILATSGFSAASAQQSKIDVKGFHLKPLNEAVVAGYLSELNGKYKMTVSQFTFDPGGHVGPHHHAGPGFRCVTSGEITNVEPDKTTVIRAGECYWEAGDNEHSPRNDTDKPVVGLVIELLPVSLTGTSLLPVPASKKQ